MASVSKIDSNITGLSYAVEQTIGVLPVLPVFYPLEPNSYSDFGGELALTTRSPINPSRQREKGVITDLDASGGFNTDLTQKNLQGLLQGFMFADIRTKNTAVPVASVSAAGVYSISTTTGYTVGSLVFMAGFTNAANNGLKVVTVVTANVSITVSGTTVAETPSTLATLSRVGYRSETAADLKIDTTGVLPALTSTTKDLTSLGLIVGEWVFIGGDLAANQFATADNNGFKRVKSITINRIEFDKSSTTMVTDAAAGKSIDIYFGSVLKNETGSLIKRRTFQLERTLGVSDDALPTQIQSEYLIGAVPNELNLSVKTSDKITMDMSFIATGNEQRSGVLGVKSGTRIALQKSDAFNTSSDFSRIKLSKVVENSYNPTPLFAYITDLTLNINNNISPNKAIGILGAFDATAGIFATSGQITAYFTNVESAAVVRNATDVSLDMIVVRNNAGIAVDLPLLTLGGGKVNVQLDSPITIPLTMEAATGSKLDPNLNHTLLFVFFDYLPSLADV